MRPSSLAFALACAVALPSGAALFGLPASVCLPLVGVGLGLGLGIMAAIDLRDYLDGRTLDLDDLRTRTYAVYLSNVEREQRLAAPEPVEAVEAKEPEYDSELEAWRVALDRFFRAGEAAGGFSAGKLAGVAGSDAWPKLVHFYASAAGGNILRDSGGNVGHVWGHGWSLDRVMLSIGTNRLPLPLMPLPVIAPYVAVAPQRNRAQRTARVVDGVAKAAE